MKTNLWLGVISILLIFLAGLGCSKLGKLTKVDLFEGDNAAKAVAAIKKKIGADKVNMIRAEIRPNEMELTIQSPTNPKDIDKYTYKNGTVTGPEPVQVIAIGNLSMTGDKYTKTDLDDVAFANVPAAIADAIKFSQLENAKVTLISFASQQRTAGSPDVKAQREKELKDMQDAVDAKLKDCRANFSSQCMQEYSKMQQELFNKRMGRALNGGMSDLVMTWRLFVESPRGRKDFWANKDGKVNPEGF